MSTNHEYTPTTQYLQNAYVDTRYNLAAEQGEFPPPIMERYAEFDRWLAEHDATVEAAAEQRGAERGWDEAMTAQIQRLISGDPDVERFQMPANPYRANQEVDE